MIAFMKIEPTAPGARASQSPPTIHDVARRAAVSADGCTVTVSVCSTDTDQAKESPRILGPDRVDGLAVTGGPLPAHHLRTIRAAGLPLVMLGADAEPGVWAVTQDHRRGTEQ